jgi:hypothetical protein
LQCGRESILLESGEARSSVKFCLGDSFLRSYLSRESLKLQKFIFATQSDDYALLNVLIARICHSIAVLPFITGIKVICAYAIQCTEFDVIRLC